MSHTYHMTSLLARNNNLKKKIYKYCRKKYVSQEIPDLIVFDFKYEIIPNIRDNMGNKNN